jgi:N-acetylmuramoyl-L-alanine amidase
MRAATLAVIVLSISIVATSGCAGSGPAAGTDGIPPRTASSEATATIVPPQATATPDTRLTIVLDAGHGGDEVGAAGHGVVEKHSNLDLAMRVEQLLVAQGYEVVLTRRSDARAAPAPALGSSFGATRFDLQARVDLANAPAADVFISIHSNGSPSASESGVEVWYDPQREFGDENRALAASLQRGVLTSLAAYGYDALDRGLKDDTCFRERFDRCFPLFVLGPERVIRREDLLRRGLDPANFGFADDDEVRTTRATQMPGALVELLFITNAADAAVLSDDAGRDAIARGVADGIVEFLSRRP